MDRGSLRSLMKQRQLASNTRLRLLMQVALAMDYLHSRKVIHRGWLCFHPFFSRSHSRAHSHKTKSHVYKHTADLNPNNIMVTGPYENLQAKVADFGLSRLGEALFHTKTVGTVCGFLLLDPPPPPSFLLSISLHYLFSCLLQPVFAAPEVLVSGSFSPKSDSYSFGVTMWFAETEEEPFADLQSHFELVQAVVKNGTRPDITKCILLPELITSCWHQDPARRPAFAAIATTLQKYLHQDPIELQ